MSDEIVLIQNLFYEIRGQKVMLDSDLAKLYQVETRVLNQAVKRNLKRFPPDFMFRLTAEEVLNMSSQNVTTSTRPTSAPPFAFTEQGVAMLSGVLKSDIAIAANISIMRAFVQVRQYLLASVTVSAELNELRAKVDLLQLQQEENLGAVNDLSEDVRQEIDNLYLAIAELSSRLEEKKNEPRPKIGFQQNMDKLLLFFQFNGRIRPGGLEGLPEDGSEGHGNCKQHGHDKDPPVALEPVNEVFEVFLGRIDGDWNADDASNPHHDHVLTDRATRFRFYRSSKHLPDGDVAGLFIGIIGAHGYQAQQGDDNGQEHKNLHQTHVVAGRFPGLSDILVNPEGQVVFNLLVLDVVIVSLHDLRFRRFPVRGGFHDQSGERNVLRTHQRNNGIIFFTNIGVVGRERFENAGYLFAALCPSAQRAADVMIVRIETGSDKTLVREPDTIELWCMEILQNLKSEHRESSTVHPDQFVKDVLTIPGGAVLAHIDTAGHSRTSSDPSHARKRLKGIF
ncbi:MAG: ORF6N domain-containing protein, partial [Bacteroidales bacterium]|nr:ORF6N domain-containing protein [Bacteroidales bacterium]